MPADDDAQQLYYSPDQVARRIAVSTRTVYRWIEMGHLPVVRFGRLVRIRHDDLLAFIEKQARGDLPRR